MYFWRSNIDKYISFDVHSNYLEMINMNGNDRRRLELYHPELTLTTLEINIRREFVKDMMSLSKCICMTFMILGVVIIAYTSTRYMGWTGFSIAFFGILLDVILGMLIAYNLGEKMKVLFTERFINNNVHSIY